MLLAQLYGEGHHADFETLLDDRIAPHLSAHAYAFWKTNASDFNDKFYSRGYSGYVTPPHPACLKG